MSCWLSSEVETVSDCHLDTRQAVFSLLANSLLCHAVVCGSGRSRSRCKCMMAALLKCQAKKKKTQTSRKGTALTLNCRISTCAASHTSSLLLHFVCVCVCRCACVSGILKKMKVFQDYLDQHRDLISLVAKIVLATGNFYYYYYFFIESSFTGTNTRVQCIREDFHSFSLLGGCGILIQNKMSYLNKLKQKILPSHAVSCQ